MKFILLPETPFAPHLLTSLLLLNASAAFAATGSEKNSLTADDQAEDELFFEVPMVLSANRLEQPVSDAAVSISVIDRDTIEMSGARNIPEVLRLVPGMQVGYSGNEFGDEPRYVVTYHGHSDQYSKQMQVLIDGRSIYEPFYGGINWLAIPININDIERIEVSRGPNLASYGANSFQAAINIITRTAAEDQGSFVQSNAGTNGIADLTYRFGGNNGDLDYRVTASTYNDDGMDSGNANDNVDDRHSNNIDYRLDYQLNNNNTLSYQGGYGENRQQADRNHEGPLPTQRTVENLRFFQFIKWENHINSDNSIQLQYYYNLNDKEDRYDSDTIDVAPGVIDPFELDVNADIKTERHNLEFTHFLYPDKDLKLIWGLVAQIDLVTSPLYLGKDDSVSHRQQRAFATIEWSASDSNVINVGVLVEEHELSETEVSPRVSLTHTFNRNHKIRFGVSQAKRGPFIFETMADQSFSQDLTSGGVPIPPGLGIPTSLYEQIILSDQDLKSEKITSREIAYFGEFLNSALLVNGRVFYDSISRYIDTLRESAPPGDNVPDDITDPASPNTMLVFYNVIESTTTGAEIELDYHIDSSLRLIASGALIHIRSDSDAASRSAPQRSYSFLVSKRFNNNYNSSLGYYFVEGFKWMDARGTDDYRILDLRLSRNFRSNWSNGSISLVLKNLLDDYSDYSSPPRNPTAPQVIQSTQAYIDFRLNF